MTNTSKDGGAAFPRCRMTAISTEELAGLLADKDAHDGLNDGICWAESIQLPKVSMDTAHARMLYDRAALAPTLAARVLELEAENERLRKQIVPEWFYPADGYDGEHCCFGVHEVLDEHYFWDRPKSGTHVVEINVASSLPSIWAAVRFNCECPDHDDCDCDNEMIVTEHATEEDARAALNQTGGAT